MISNDADKVKCVACETPKPGGGGAAASGLSKKSEAQTPSTDPLMAKFMTKGANSSNWSCEVCMISNPSDKVKCIACETPNPKAKASASDEETKPTFNFGAGGGFKFGTGAEPSAPSTGFKFGASDAQAHTSTADQVSGFKFGNSSEAASSKPAQVNEFKFGATEVSSNVATSGFFSTSSPFQGPTGFLFSSTEKYGTDEE